MLAQSEKYILRRAVPGDALDIAKINVDSWKTTYSGIIHSTFLDSLTYEKNLAIALRRIDNENSDCLVAVNKFDQNIIGFIQVGPCREKNIDADCEIYALYLYKEFQGQGAGTLLFGSAVSIAKDKNYNKLMVSVLEKNSIGRSFYKRMGGSTAPADHVDLDGVRYTTATYVWAL